MMEEELDYVAVIFKSNGVPAHEEPNNPEIVYDEVKTEEGQQWDTGPITAEDPKRAALCPPLAVVAAGLGLICVVLVSLVIALSCHFTSEQSILMRQNQQLWTEKTALERQTEELARERDKFNWTLGVILDHDTFPVDRHCPQRVCKPCLDPWVPFQSNCYWFSSSEYYSGWRSWQGGQDLCRDVKADLVVIDSQEEQEFINNHTTEYDDVHHGYWVGLSNKKTGTWTWLDGSNLTVMYWLSDQAGYPVSCALSLPSGAPLANWYKASCSMKNRWICERRALIKAD